MCDIARQLIVIPMDKKCYKQNDFGKYISGVMCRIRRMNSKPSTQNGINLYLFFGSPWFYTDKVLSAYALTVTKEQLGGKNKK